MLATFPAKASAVADGVFQYWEWRPPWRRSGPAATAFPRRGLLALVGEPFHGFLGTKIERARIESRRTESSLSSVRI